MSRCVIVIPARYGSTRFPGKLLHPLQGKPLIQHVFERCLKSREATQIVVATDDMRIAECAFGFGAEVALTPASLPSGTDRAARVIARMAAASIVINVQGDEPLIEPALIDRLAREMKKNSRLQMATAAVPFAMNEDSADPNKVKVVCDAEGNALYFSRSEIPFHREDSDASPKRLRHLGIYAYRRTFLLRLVKTKATALENAERLEQLRALHLGAKIRVLQTRHASPGVDTPEDAKTVEKMLARKHRRK